MTYDEIYTTLENLGTYCMNFYFPESINHERKDYNGYHNFKEYYLHSSPLSKYIEEIKKFSDYNLPVVINLTNENYDPYKTTIICDGDNITIGDFWEFSKFISSELTDKQKEYIKLYNVMQLI